MLLNNGKILTPLVIIATAAVIASGLYLSRSEPAKNAVEQQPLLINAARAVKQDIQISVRSQGTIMPRTSTTLIAEVTGRIINLSAPFKVGGFFKQGDTLLRIDPRDYQADLKRAAAAVASAKSNLASEQGKAEVAYQDWMKYKSSVKRSEAATALALRKPQLEDAQAKLDSALADLDHARDQLDRTVIRAPYDGLLKTKQVDIGQYVNTGAKLADIFAIDTAELRLPLPENKLNYLQLPSINHNNTDKPEVSLLTEVSGERQQWQAQLVRTEGVFDERSRVLFAVAEINDPYGIQSPREHVLRMGTFVDASIEGRTIANLVALPRHILRAGNQLWVIDQQQRLQNRQVSILRTEGSQIYVTNGLSEGELVCLSNISGAVPGTKVRIADIIPSSHHPEPKQPVLPEPSVPSQEGILNVAPVTAPPTNPPIPPANEASPSTEKQAA